MKTARKITAFCAVSAAIIGLVTASLVLLRDTSLLAAAKSCDNISIAAKYDAEKHTLLAAQQVTYKNRSNMTLNEVKFHIYANAYREGARFSPVEEKEIPDAYPNGESFGGITINQAFVNSSGKDTNTAQPNGSIEGEDDTVLSVPIKDGLPPGKTARIDIDYTVQLANIRHRLGWTDNAANLGNFYPVPCIFENGGWQTYPYSFNGDPFYNALHNFNVSIELPHDFTVASSGILLKSTKSGEKKTETYRSSAIRDFAMVLSSKFKTKTRFANKIAISYYWLDDADPNASLTTAAKAIHTFSRLFVKYPYRQLSVVQTDFLHGGMEYGELVYISADILNPDLSNKNQHPSSATEEHDPANQNDTVARADHDRVIVHEIAHQWWYGIIGNNQTRTAWIDEGLAEYSTLLFYDNNSEYNIDRAKYINNARENYSLYVKLARLTSGIFDSNMERDLISFNNSYEYVLLSYIRGMLLFCDLEMLLTRNTLEFALGQFAKTAQFSIVTPATLIASLEKTTKSKLGLFFESYINGPGETAPNII